MAAQKPKIQQSAAKPRKIVRRGPKQGASLLSIRLNPVGYDVRIVGAGLTTNHVVRVWTRSIKGCGKVVKEKTTSDHKMFGSWCRNCLLVVVGVPEQHLRLSHQVSFGVPY